MNRKLLQVAALLMPAFMIALPQSIDLVLGKAAVSVQDQTSMVIEVADQSIIQYESFNIAEGEKVIFVQPGKGASVLNRVIGQDPSQILGKMEGNGKVFLVNERGIYFGKNSTVNVGSLVASTLNIKDLDFLEDHHAFALESDASNIINKGSLYAEDAIVLLSSGVTNEGSIVAKLGKVLLAAGQKVVLDFDGRGLMGFSVEGELAEAFIEQAGSIEALKGDVHLKISSARSIVDKVINIEGIELGEEIVEENGSIFLAQGSKIKAKKVEVGADSGGRLFVDGEITTASATGKGGQIELYADKVLLGEARLDATGQSGGGGIVIGKQECTTSFIKVSSNTKMFTSALAKGDGGSVHFYSHDAVDFSGTILSQGGPTSGNGGAVEMIGCGSLTLGSGLVDTGAPKGKIGTWLIDPPELIVSEAEGVSPLVIGRSVANITLSAGDGKIKILEPISMQTKGASVTLAAKTLSLHEGITTKGGSILLEGEDQKCFLEGNILFDTTDGGLHLRGADIAVPGKIEGAYKLTLEAGKQGTVDIGAEGDIMDLASILVKGKGINLCCNIEASGGTIILEGPVTLQNDLVLIDRGPTGVIFAGTVNSSPGLPKSLSVLATRGRIAFLQEVGGGNQLQDLTIESGIIDLRDSIAIAGSFLSLGPITLLGNVAIKSTDIDIRGSVNGAYNFSVDGTALGSINLAYPVGVEEAIREFHVTDFATLRAQGIIAEKITQAGGTSGFYNGFLESIGKDGISLTGETFFFDGFIKANNGGGIQIDNSGIMSSGIDLEIVSSGAFDQIGSGEVHLFGTISTDGGDIAFASPVTLIGPLALSTGGGTGDIVFSDTVDGGHTLSMDLQIGNLVLDKAVGFKDSLGTFIVHRVRNVNAGRIHAENVIQREGYGLSRYFEDIEVTGKIGISITANYLEFAGAVAGKVLKTIGDGHIILNSIYGSVGSLINPVDVDAASGRNNLFIGSAHPSYVVSPGDDVKLLGGVRSNVPCFVLYNGTVYEPRGTPIDVGN